MLLSSTQQNSDSSIASSNFTALQGTNGMLLLGCLAAFALLAYLEGKSGKGKLATARFGGAKEKSKAKRKALKQMQSPRKHNEVGFKIYDSIYLPYAERGIAICGGSGSGKTDSMILPIIYSAIEQDCSLIVYDFKYSDPRDSLAAAVVPEAVKHGYEPYIFAPGFPESQVCNVLEFLKDDLDGLEARQLGSVMNKNLKPTESDSESAFFSIAGDLISQATLLLAKQTPFPDLVMCQALLNLEKLPDRIRSSETLPYLTKATFAQYLSVAKSEKTADSIRGTAQNLFSPFTSPGLASAFCGKSTLPLDVQKKQLIIIGVDKDNRDAVAPFLAGVVHMMVNRSMAKPRTRPLVVVLDELHTLNLKSLADWLAQNRSAGQITCIAFQDLGQIEQRYGKEGARSLLSNCATHAIFKSQEGESSRTFSDFLGDEEVLIKQKSRGHSDGKRQASTNDQRQTRKLFSADQFTKLARGSCILLNPGFASRGEEGIPLRIKIKLSKQSRDRKQRNIELWDKKVRPRLIERSPQPKFVDRNQLRDYMENLLKERAEAAEQLLPSDPKKAQNSVQLRNETTLKTGYAPPELEAEFQNLPKGDLNNV